LVLIFRLSRLFWFLLRPITPSPPNFNHAAFLFPRSFKSNGCFLPSACPAKAFYFNIVVNFTVGLLFFLRRSRNSRFFPFAVSSTSRTFSFFWFRDLQPLPFPNRTMCVFHLLRFRCLLSFLLPSSPRLCHHECGRHTFLFTPTYRPVGDTNTPFQCLLHCEWLLPFLPLIALFRLFLTVSPSGVTPGFFFTIPIRGGALSPPSCFFLLCRTPPQVCFRAIERAWFFFFFFFYRVPVCYL